jgi:hypothetical protein
MPMHSPDPGKTSTGAHARNAWTCPCGKTVHGNGAEAAHKNACRTWTETLLARTELALVGIRGGQWGQRLAPETVAVFRRQFGRQQARLRGQLALPPASYASTAPGTATPISVRSRRRTTGGSGGTRFGRRPHARTTWLSGKRYGRSGRCCPAGTARP